MDPHRDALRSVAQAGRTPWRQPQAFCARQEVHEDVLVPRGGDAARGARGPNLDVRARITAAAEHVEVLDAAFDELGARGPVAGEAVGDEALDLRARRERAVLEHEARALGHDQHALEAREGRERARFLDRGPRDAPEEVSLLEARAARPERELVREPAAVLPRHAAGVGW